MADAEQPKLSKKEAKKLAKKAAKKAAKEAANPQVEEPAAPSAPVGVYETDHQYGSYPTMSSERRTDRVFTHVSELGPDLIGQKVWVRARVYTSRSKGNSCFILLRRSFYTVQAALFKSDKVPKEMVKFAASVMKETFIDVYAEVVAVPEKIASATQQDVELAVEKLFVMKMAEATPIQVEDCNRVEPRDDEAPPPEGSQERPKVALKSRLDYRYLDIRAPVNLSIFRIQHGVCCLFREYLTAKGFVETHTPKLLGAGSESGAEIFEVGYFDRTAYLAQSPQLFKQMATVSDLERVFEVAPVFRAENSNTNRHLTEFMGLDVEMVIQEHYYEALGVFNEMFKYIFTGLESRFAKELATIREVYPSEPVQYSEDFLVLSFPEAVRMLRESGEELEDLEDLSTPHEKKVGRMVKEKFGTDFYAIDKYPVNARPFYTMPNPEDSNYTNSYDLFLRGQEISSGAQRVHESELLLKVAEGKGMDLSPVQAYVDAFKYGALPHAGCGIGLERVVFLYLGLHDIRKASMFPRDPNRISP